MENDSFDSFLHYFASPENFTSATLQPVHDTGPHALLEGKVGEYESSLVHLLHVVASQSESRN